jgi:hypothetical protein
MDRRVATALKLEVMPAQGQMGSSDILMLASIPAAGIMIAE